MADARDLSATQPAAAAGRAADNLPNVDRTSFRQTSEETDELGMLRRRYQQLINGLPVEGTAAIDLYSNGQLKESRGEWIRQTPADLPKRQLVNESQALRNALKFVGATVYKWELPEAEEFLKQETGNPAASFRPQGSLVYYAGSKNLNNNITRLAYRFDIYAEQPLSRQNVYVDALNGRVLGSNALLQEIDAASTFNTGYSGPVTITTDRPSQTSTTFRLRAGVSLTSGRKIETYNLRSGTSYLRAIDFTNTNSYTTTAAKDIYAIDAHYGAEKTYDFYQKYFGRNSIDYKGFTLKSYVHYSRGYFNAFWDGSRMTYGDGSTLNGSRPLTSLDVCGHEITHGLTSFSANLNYSYESGALNEGFSDIFGVAIEAFARGRTGIGVNSSRWNWTLGEDFGYIVRDMVSPKLYGNPDTYAGNLWYTGTADNGGVHTNSGVLNYWFAVLTEGSGRGIEHPNLDIDGTTDTNDKGYRFDVNGIGLDNAQAIAYRVLTSYLTPTSQFLDARKASIAAAADLVNQQKLSPQQAGEVAYAWDAVGVGGGTSVTYTPTLTGTAAADSLYGGHLGDVITGNGGIDQIWGNGGPDSFVLANSTTEFYTTATEVANINDFSLPDNDKLLLKAGATYNYQYSPTDNSTSLYRDGTGDQIASISGIDLSAGLGGGSFSQTLNAPAWASFT